ncbi:hypothetical protein PF327_07245 [Sulfurovum sp. XTW-4]|uniref:Uncharacterized protein n=1 Tax=Sulfurovum xiamenensis TaxID=3019066 RepID=A0ABT7QT86_9BACT|nr:hypothetical protein [Sulfurovum xiamenensis]MDM5263992.1 hypothetical protein [Sulfurovum xiamenensis]
MKFIVLLRGENFEINYDGKIQNVGFMTTRTVKASNSEEAELAAVELIKNDDYLIQMVVKDSTLTPKIYLEEIAEAKWWVRLGGKGYTFFPMDEEENEY